MFGDKATAPDGRLLRAHQAEAQGGVDGGLESQLSVSEILTQVSERIASLEEEERRAKEKQRAEEEERRRAEETRRRERLEEKRRAEEAARREKLEEERRRAEEERLAQAARKEKSAKAVQEAKAEKAAQEAKEKKGFSYYVRLGLATVFVLMGMLVGLSLGSNLLLFAVLIVAVILFAVLC